MRKSVKLFCEQNPIINPSCPNCNKPLSIKSKVFFENPTYKCVCPNCKADLVFDTNEFVNDFEKQLKKLGISW